MRALADFGFLFLFFILVAVWAICWAAFHIAGAFIHILLFFAVISLIIHFFRSRRVGHP